MSSQTCLTNSVLASLQFRHFWIHSFVLKHHVGRAMCQSLPQLWISKLRNSIAFLASGKKKFIANMFSFLCCRDVPGSVKRSTLCIEEHSALASFFSGRWDDSLDRDGSGKLGSFESQGLTWHAEGTYTSPKDPWIHVRAKENVLKERDRRTVNHHRRALAILFECSNNSFIEREDRLSSAKHSSTSQLSSRR